MPKPVCKLRDNLNSRRAHEGLETVSIALTMAELVISKSLSESVKVELLTLRHQSHPYRFAINSKTILMPTITSTTMPTVPLHSSGVLHCGCSIIVGVVLVI